MGKRLSGLRLSTKILLLGLALSVALPVVLLTWLLPEQKSNAYAMQEDATKHLVEAAWGILNYYGHEASRGAMTDAQAQAAAKDAIRSVRYQGNNYIWINDLRPVMIMHPTNAALEGKDLSDYRDPKGLAIFVEAVRIARERGEGVIRYMWPKPGQSQPAPKISYVKLYAPWGWILGTGIYVDDTELILSRARSFIFVLTAAVLLVSLLLCYLLTRSIVAPILRTTGTIGQVVRETNGAANQVASASQEIASRVTEQAASMQETSASLEELRANCQTSSSNAKRIREVVAEVGQVIDAGNREMTEMNGAIDEIGRAAHDVRKIVKTIEDVAFQTNILALNAAVEAARAGEAGAGFSVVADEVRSLAQRASQAAQETANIIGNSLASSERGAATSLKLSAALATILTKIAEVRTASDQIADSVETQTRGVAQINSAVLQLNDATQSQAASSEETASAAAELHAQSDSLSSLTRELHEIVMGS
ncbi:MAG TPA: cache domain-containing protein [Bryobacteraceae bacterium]|nr:cache domain-containing protein [Bryobacteraceae bacterium]